MALWNHDQDEPLMTRRKFFFLTGMAGAFAVAQQAGLVVLAEHAAPIRTWTPLWGIDCISSCLKDVYEPFIAAQMAKDTELMKLLGGWDAPQITGRKHHIPMATVPNANRRRAARG